jgi:F0F1-type ATP synthase membrane subunit c/vacuolar-type H+-ATPase subunit K
VAERPEVKVEIWILTLIAAVVAIVGLTVAVLLWPGRLQKKE